RLLFLRSLSTGQQAFTHFGTWSRWFILSWCCRVGLPVCFLLFSGCFTRGNPGDGSRFIGNDGVIVGSETIGRMRGRHVAWHPWFFRHRLVTSQPLGAGLLVYASSSPFWWFQHCFDSSLLAITQETHVKNVSAPRLQYCAVVPMGKNS